MNDWRAAYSIVAASSFFTDATRGNEDLFEPFPLARLRLVFYFIESVANACELRCGLVQHRRSVSQKTGLGGLFNFIAERRQTACAEVAGAAFESGGGADDACHRGHVTFGDGLPHRVQLRGSFL